MVPREVCGSSEGFEPPTYCLEATTSIPACSDEFNSSDLVKGFSVLTYCQPDPLCHTDSSGRALDRDE